MSVGFPSVGGASQIGHVPSLDREPPTTRKPFAAELGLASNAAPPPEVQAEVQAAARCANRLHEMGRQLRFEPDPEGGRVRVQVCDLDGNVIRTIPLNEALEIARGKRLD